MTKFYPNTSVRNGKSGMVRKTEIAEGFYLVHVTGPQRTADLMDLQAKRAMDRVRRKMKEANSGD